MSEIEKALAVKEKSQAIGEFLEWAQSEGYFLASWQHFGNPEPEGYDRLVTSRKTIRFRLERCCTGSDRLLNWIRFYCREILADISRAQKTLIRMA